MKKTTSILAAAAMLCMFYSCRKVTGEGPMQTEIRAITGFSGVSSGISAKINYTIEPAFKVEIIARRNVLDVIETSLANGHLLIKIRNNVTIKNSDNIIVNISAPTADYLHVSGSGNLAVSGNIVTENLTLSISGSGGIVVPQVTVADEINAVISGSGNINVQAGLAKNEELRISGSGKILLAGVAAEKAVTATSGSGDMQVKVSQTLEATISGSGSVYYLGSPAISKHISGSGKVKQL